MEVPGYGWRKTDWVEDELKIDNKVAEDTLNLVEYAVSADEDIGMVVENFKEAHQDFEVKLENENRLITVSLWTTSQIVNY